MSFHSILYFFVFLLPTYYDIWLYHHTMIYLLVDFRGGDFDERVVSTRLKKVKSNICLSICFIKSGILSITDIL